MNEKLKKPRRTSKSVPRRPTVVPSPKKPNTLRFSPTAWAKLLFLRDLGETEVGGFGISPIDDLGLVEDFQLVRQTCSMAHVCFDDESVADFFDRQIDLGNRPEQFGRIWVHTHPGSCPRPSGTDEQTFDRVFGRADWAVMFILAREGATYARLRFNVGPRTDVELVTEVDFSREFDRCDHAQWRLEYEQNVSDEILRCEPATIARTRLVSPTTWPPGDWYEPWFEYLDDDLAMERRDDINR